MKFLETWNSKRCEIAGFGNLLMN